MVECHASLEPTLDITRAWSSPVPGSGGDGSGVRGPDPSDPTGNAATQERARLERLQYPLIRSHMDTIITAVSDLRLAVERNRPPDDRETKKRYREAHSLTHIMEQCASDDCAEDAVPQHRHCESCNDYLNKHPHIRIVPRQVVLTRKRVRKLREKNRVHISGPVQDDAALIM